jgi:MFS family permease
MTMVPLAGSLVDRLRTRTFSALVKYPNYRLYWFGALASNIGTWTQMVAQGWLVYQLTGSAFYLGAVGFASAIPTLFLLLFGGVLADRFERRRLMVGTQTGSMILAFTLAALTLLGHITVWHIMVIALLNGVVNSLNAPVRQTIISDLVAKEDLTNAIAINSTQFQASRTLGPAIAGVIVALVGPGWCFFINGLSFVAVIAALLAMTVPPLPPRKTKTSLLANVREGVAYVRGNGTLLALLSLAVVPSLFAMPYQALMPIFASDVLGTDARGLGLLGSASGLGAVVGALSVASLGKGAARGRLMLGAITAFGLGLILFSLSRSMMASLLILVGVGVASMAYNALNQSFIQMHAADEMRGRVMSLLTLTTFGLQPFGQLGIGTAAQLLGPSAAVLASGAVCAALALWMFIRRPAIRQLR